MRTGNKSRLYRSGRNIHNSHPRCILILNLALCPASVIPIVDVHRRLSVVILSDTVATDSTTVLLAISCDTPIRRDTPATTANCFSHHEWSCQALAPYYMSDDVCRGHSHLPPTSAHPLISTDSMLSSRHASLQELPDPPHTRRAP